MSDQFSFTWGDSLAGFGHVQIFQFMLETYSVLGLTIQEMMLIVHLASYHYNTPNGESRPSQATVAKHMGYGDRKRVSELVLSLEKKGMLHITREPGQPNIYDASPFADAALALWKGVGVPEPDKVGAPAPKGDGRSSAHEEEETQAEEGKKKKPPRVSLPAYRPGLGEPEYVDDPFEKPRPAIVRSIMNHSRRKLSQNQVAKMMAGVPQNLPRYSSPAHLFDTDPLFQLYVQDIIAWADGGSGEGRKPTGSLVSAIRNYERPRTGWLEYKQKWEEEEETIDDSDDDKFKRSEN